jgi:hypothetical protein
MRIPDDAVVWISRLVIDQTRELRPEIPHNNRGSPPTPQSIGSDDILLAMKPASRILAALLALSTLAATAAQAGSAMNCDGVEQAAASHDGHDSLSTSEDRSASEDSSRLPGAQCPTGAPVGCLSAFVPTSAIVARLEPASDPPITGKPDSTVDLLPIPPPLRPPCR